MFLKKHFKAFCFPFMVMSIVLCSAAFAYGQNVREMIREADLHMRDGQADAAVENYLKAYSYVPEHALLGFKLGRAYLESSFKYKALPHLLKAYQEIPESDPDIKFYLAQAYQYNYQFEQAVSYYLAYQEEKPEKETEIRKRIAACKIAEELYKHPREVEIANLGSAVNSPEHDFSPLITPDEKMLVFTSRREGSTGGKTTAQNEYFEDIYLSYKVGGTLWTKPQNISRNINTPFHDAAAALSPDGKKLFVYLDQGGGDLFMSEFDGVSWSRPETLGSQVNTRYWETSVTITADGKRIYFASNRPGGFGKRDIYVSHLQADGKWGAAQNLGPAINTAEDEDAPFVHPDGQTLYFSSNGHPGMGGFDIFKSELVNGNWGVVENFGYPVNTTDNDMQFVMTGNRKKAYYTSVKEDGLGRADIYSLSFPYNTSKPPASVVPLLVNTPKGPEGEKTVLTGNVADHSKEAPLSATVSLTNNKTAELVAEDRADPETGRFELVVYGLGSFALNVEAEGFMFYSKNVKITKADQKKGKKEIGVDVKLQPIGKGSRVVLSNIFFNTGAYKLREESFSELEKVVKYLQNSPKLKLQINGHTDNTGDGAFNKELSRKRAESVRSFLIKGGIEPDRLTAVGFGEERPLVSNDDERDGRELNRRTEIEVTDF